MTNHTGADISAIAITEGHASGPLVHCSEPLSFWGGFDSSTGQIVERDHPQAGVSLKGRVLLMASAKGSSSSASVLAEAIRNGTAPNAIIMQEADLILALGAIVATELYGLSLPIVRIAPSCWESLAKSTGPVSVDSRPDGTGTIKVSDAERSHP